MGRFFGLKFTIPFWLNCFRFWAIVVSVFVFHKELAHGESSHWERKERALITDGQWQRIGFVWDGSNRTLYVDDIAVAQDTQTDMKGSDSSLNIGTGNALETGTFWSGLIDEVLIYNRAVSP